MVQATIELLQQRGYAGTSFGDVMAASGAPRGSIYHHFPGGKQELVAEALRRYAAGIRRRLVAVAETGSGVELVRALLGAMRDGLRASDFSVGCAVAGVVLDLAPDPDLALLTPAAEALDGWRGVIATALTRDGMAKARAQRVATLVLAAFEGAIILARAQRSTGPLDEVEQELTVLLA
jgi:AcrR family transcriptional regulator